MKKSGAYKHFEEYEANQNYEVHQMLITKLREMMLIRIMTTKDTYKQVG